MTKKSKSQKSKPDPETTQDNPTVPEGLDETDFPPLPDSPTETAPTLGNRQATQPDTGDLTQGLPNSGLTVPGITDTGKKDDKDDKGSLQIKIHLNLHAKVKLELDAQIYGDVVIGLL